MLIIGFGHKARRGKDTLAQHLIASRLGKRLIIRRYAFADELKLEVTLQVRKLMEIYDLNDQEAMHRLCQTADVEYDAAPDMSDPLCPYGKQRKLLQWWGTEYRRSQDPDYWVDKCLATIMADNPDVAIITDMRFPNEAALVKRAGGITVRLDRPGFEIDSQAAQHPSETAMDSFKYDYVIQADTVDKLKAYGLSLFDQIIMERL